MRIKVDEDLPRAIAERLREAGYEATTVVEQGMGGFKDPEVWKAVQAKSQLLLTGDKGFADLRRFPPGSHHGVVLLRPGDDGIRPLVELAERLLAERPLDRFAGSVTVVTPNGLRIRRS